jgi:hypothetical protein
LLGKSAGRFENENEDGAEFAFADTELLQESGGLSRSADVGWNLESWKSQVSKPNLPRSLEYCPIKILGGRLARNDGGHITPCRIMFEQTKQSFCWFRRRQHRISPRASHVAAIERRVVLGRTGSAWLVPEKLGIRERAIAW